MNSKLFEKAKENYIREGYLRLANIEAMRNWAKTENTHIPAFTMPKVKKNLVGWKNFTRLVMELRP